jgi:hypothetical protein
MNMDFEDPIDAKLDRALEMTFPASDPFTIILPEVQVDDEDARVDPNSVMEAAARFSPDRLQALADYVAVADTARVCEPRMRHVHGGACQVQ